MGKSGESTGTQKDQEPPKDGLGNAFQRTGDAPSGIRARDASGKFLPDIKETTQYNEAWVGGKSPKDMAASAAAAKQTGSPVTAATPSASQPKVGAITGRTNWWNVHERSPSGLVLGRAWKARQFIFALVPPLCAFILFENVDRWQKRNDAKKNANAGADLKVAPGAGGDISAMRSFGSFVQDAVGAAVLGKAMSAENRRFLEVRVCVCVCVLLMLCLIDLSVFKLSCHAFLILNQVKLPHHHQLTSHCFMYTSTLPYNSFPL